MPEDLSKSYEAKLAKLIRAYSRRIQDVYYTAINEVTLFSALSSLNDTNPTLLSKSIFDAFPALKNKFDEIMQTMHDGIYQNVARSINDSWQLSNQKNDKITDDITKGTELASDIKDLVYNPNADALEAFINRKTQGLNLSDRVWNLVEPYSYELEAGLADGIGKGKPAAEMATDLKRYLKRPDDLFRRVRDNETGQLQLSRAAQKWSVEGGGRGIYRSSYKNALRLTGTETNMAYRNADGERWKKQTFVRGYEIRTSNNHPLFDICDILGNKEYPKEFNWSAWHPNCRCVKIPVLVSDEEYSKQEDFLLGLTDKEPDINYIEKLPPEFNKYVKDNAKRINSWSSKPYWISENKKMTKDLLKTKK